jgi:uncharacterized protein DUF4035
VLALAAHLGMTVGRLLREMTVKEFAMWRLEYSQRPFGERRADIRMAQMCALFANANRDAKKRPDSYTIVDFLMFEDKPEEPEVKDIVSPETKAWLYAMAKRSKRGN